uniref:GDP-fucose protein O-fucosyltransferase 2 n=1 Tax=Saccoglossus kowalevskii TaxID=10224 RepID=A0ABM0MZT9_SACKO|nr:PREDICTED: uncharacterized protein LOC100368607 [Saccoglossus kowalevskii]
MDKDQQTPRRYLLPIQRSGGGGTNTQYFNFANAVMLAILTNRTIVLTPFFLHGGHTRGYIGSNMRSFNNTFNEQTLSRIVPVATIDEFKKHCQGSISVLSWERIEAKYMKTRETVFKNILKIKNLPLYDELNIIRGTPHPDAVASIHKDEPCLSIYRPHEMHANITVLNYDLEKHVHSHLIRSEKIQHYADTISKHICGGRPYLAFHWRNKTTENGCIFDRYEKQGNLNTSCTNRLPEVALLAEYASTAIADIMKKLKIHCIYVATPEWSKTILHMLGKQIPRVNIYSTSDIIDVEDLSSLRDDYYSLSLVEQEICYRADYFIASCKSHWSKFVMADRVVAGKNYTCTKNLPGLDDLQIARFIKDQSRRKK